MGGKTLKTATINVRIAQELKDAAERAAVKDRRSLTSLIEKLLDDHLHAIGEPIGKPASKRK
jgi:predicted HicB family RNase H-like nuclease